MVFGRRAGGCVPTLDLLSPREARRVPPLSGDGPTFPSVPYEGAGALYLTKLLPLSHPIRTEKRVRVSVCMKWRAKLRERVCERACVGERVCTYVARHSATARWNRHGAPPEHPPILGPTWFTK